MILRAEEELLVNVHVRLDPRQRLAFEDRLYENYASEETGETSKLWNHERRSVITQAIESFLYPAAKLWLREWLREECWEFIGRACEISLTKRIDCQPYQSTSMKKRRELNDQSELQNYGREDESDDEDDGENERREGLPKVLAISQGNGDIRKPHIETVFLDAGGRLRQRTEFESISPPASESAEALDQSLPHPSREFVQLLVSRRPDVIVINGFSPRTIAFKQEVLGCVNLAVEQILQSKNIPADQRDLAQIDVIHCHDDVARLYQHSARGAEEFPSFNTLARYCIALARYVQSPVQEFAALTEEDLLALRYDTYQQLIPRERLLNFLERALVAVINTTAVDINRAVINAYYAQQLRYVSGLGPRKADHLMRAITSQLGSYVVNRDSLLIGAAGSTMLEKDIEILSANVWHNACSFLTIRPRQGTSTVQKIKMQGRSDVLDSTRIHPEAYDYARFIAFDALRKTEEDREDDQHPSAWCAELMEDPGRRLKVEDIDMADYERNLWVEMAKRGQRRERKLSLLEFIARELVDAMAELRNDFVLPNPDEVLTMLSGETKATFDTQRLVNVTVQRIFQEFAKVTLESGIEGTIHREYLLPMNEEDLKATGQFRESYHGNARNLVKNGQILKAQIIDIDVANVRCELTARESHVEDAKAADLERRKVAVDSRYFDEVRAKVEKDQAEIQRVRKLKNSQGARSIRHPDFHNFKAGQAEEYLANLPRGTAVVRPSSKGNDHLAITWKVFDGVYQHIDVQEMDKENEYELGRILRVGSGAAGGSYSDLDELLVNHVAPMAKMVEMLTMHEKFRGSEEALQTYLSNSSLANPGKSQYGFAIDKKKPGVFILGFKANRQADVQRWPVRVLPGRFKLNEAEVPDMVSLTNSFKTQWTLMAMTAARAGGATPAIRAGMTPMGARTPAYGSMATATPNPYLAQQQRARPPPPGAPPMRPGPPPMRPPQMNGTSNGSGPAIHPSRLNQMAPAPSGWD
jgi:transcription elongation factor SPT6